MRVYLLNFTLFKLLYTSDKIQEIQRYQKYNYDQVITTQSPKVTSFLESPPYHNKDQLWSLSLMVSDTITRFLLIILISSLSSSGISLN